MDLQEIVNKIAYRKREDGTWDLDHTHSKAFYDIVYRYAYRSAHKSDWFDPEDAIGEIIYKVWDGLRRYGPNYQGKGFKSFLKMKTNNVLTSRHRKRNTDKSCLNFVNNSLDDENFYSDPSVKPIKILEFKEKLSQVPEKKLRKLCGFLKEIITMPKKVDQDAARNFINSLSSLLGVEVSSVENVISSLAESIPKKKKNADKREQKIQERVEKEFKKTEAVEVKKDPPPTVTTDKKTIRVSLSPRYTFTKYLSIFGLGDDEMKEGALKLKDCKPGEKYITAYDRVFKLIEHREDNTAEVYVELTKQTIKVPYKTDLGEYSVYPFSAVKKEEKTVEENTVEEQTPEKLGPPKEEQPQKVFSKRISLKDLDETKNSEPKEEKTTQRGLILGLVKKGPVHKKKIAEAVIDAGLSKNSDLKKVIRSISVQISNMKNKDNLPLEIKRGVVSWVQ